MKREDVKNKIPGITEEQLNWIMTENGNDVNREKAAAEQFKTQLTNTTAQLKTAQDGLKGSKDRTTDIDKALDEAVKANPWAFGEAEETGGNVHVSSGAEHGKPPAGETDSVTAAFQAMNPGIKIN